MEKIYWCIIPSFILIFFISERCYSSPKILEQPNSINEINWKAVPGTDHPSMMEPNPLPWYLGINTIVRNNDAINFDVNADGSYIRYFANCKTKKVTRILLGDIDQNRKITNVKKIDEPFFSTKDSLIRPTLNYACEQNINN